MHTLIRFLSTSLRRRLAFSIALVHALMMAMFVFDLTEREQDLLRKHAQNHLLDQVQVLAHVSRDWTLSRDVAGLNELLPPLSTQDDLGFAMIMDANGRILAHSQPEHVGQYLTDPISLNALQADAPGKARLIQDTSGLIDAIAPIRLGEQTIGWARVALSNVATHAALNQAILDGLLYTLAAILIGTLLAFLIARDLTRDLHRIRHAFTHIAQGDLAQRLPVRRKDELGELIQDINDTLERLETDERLLRQTRERLDLALRGNNDGLWDWNLKTNRVYFSPQWKAMLGHAEEEIADSLDEWISRIHPEDQARIQAALHDYLERGVVDYRHVVRMHHKDGGWRWVLTRGLTLRDEQGQAYRMVGMQTDISERIELEQELANKKERLHIILMSMADGVVVTDTLGQIELLNPAAERLTGWSFAEALGQPLDRIVHALKEGDGQRFDARTLHERVTTGPFESPARLMPRGAPDAALSIQISAARIQGEASMDGMALILHDTSETRALMEQMSWQASHDPLTALPNRTAFGDRLKGLLKDARTDRRTHALLYMDLDQFKVINDTCGHHAGDALLMALAHILQGSLRHDDMIARIGGDEFAALLPNCSLDDAMRAANVLRDNIRDFSFYWQERVFNVGASIGIVGFGIEWENADDILRAADIACYAAKEEGRNRFHVYKHTDESMTRRVNQLGMASQLQSALNEDRFTLYAQPIKALAAPGEEQDGLHLEVLGRMLDRDGKLIAPDLFISAAERYNHIHSVDRWIVSTTLARVRKALQTPGTPRLHHVGINLSGHSLTDEEMLAFIEKEVRRHDFPPGLICFEITETAIISNMHQAMNFIERMKAAGCTFALDDFGSGLSSFAYLKAMPVDYLKIDGVFVRDIESDPRDRAFVQAIHQVGRTLGLKTIAEFVENDATERILREMGVDYAQGYGISRPRPLDELLAPQPPLATRPSSPAHTQYKASACSSAS